MIITSKLKMDLNQHTAIPMIHAVQDDRYSRDLELSLFSAGVPWPVPEDASVRVRYSKSDGKGGEYDTLPDGSCAWSKAENVLTIALAPQVLTVPGPVRLSVVLLQGQRRLSTFTILVRVTAAVNAHTSESEDYFPGQNIHWEPEDTDIPRVFFGNALPQTKDDAVMTFRYISKTRDISGYCKTKAQGSSSMQFPKKNQTTKLYADADCTEELKIAFRDWGAQNKFCFKANWIDHSHARNIIGAELWSAVVASRPDYDSLPEQLRSSPNNGAISGFPVKLYAEGIYQGIYTLNIPKDAWMWNMDETNTSHVLLCAEVNNNGEEVDTSCNFRTLWESDNAWDWEVEAGERTEAIASSFNALSSCVKDTDDETFKNTIGNHLDVQSAIDYWIHQYVICNMDGLGKNLLMATYDGVKWHCGAYDMDGTFGLNYGGDKFVSARFRCPEDYQETRGLLWARISTLFADEVKARYVELRDKVYSYANLFHHFERFMDVIGSDLYAEDLTVFPDIPSASGNNIRQIRAYIKDRLYYTDVQFGLIEEAEPEKTVIVTDYIQSATDAATTFELYNGPVDWNTQGLVIEFSLEATNTNGYLFNIGEDLSVPDDDFMFGIEYWGTTPVCYLNIQSADMNGSWSITNAYMQGYVTDWNNAKLEINKNGIYLNGNDAANNVSSAEVYSLLLERFLSKSTVQIGKKNTTDALHPVTFKSVYFTRV